MNDGFHEFRKEVGATHQPLPGGVSIFSTPRSFWHVSRRWITSGGFAGGFFFSVPKQQVFFVLQKTMGKAAPTSPVPWVFSKKLPHRNKTQQSSYKKHKPNLHCINYHWYIYILVSVLLTFWYGFSKQKKHSKLLFPKKSTRSFIWRCTKQSITSWKAVETPSGVNNSDPLELVECSGSSGARGPSGCPRGGPGGLGTAAGRRTWNGDLEVWWRFRMADG